MTRALRDFGWEATLVALTLLCAAWATMLSPYYLHADQILYSLQQALAVAGLLAGGLVMIIVAGAPSCSRAWLRPGCRSGSRCRWCC